MSLLFAELVGESEDTFSLGRVQFKAAAVSLTEYGEWLAMQASAGQQGIELDAQAEWIAKKLRSRVAAGQKQDPVSITTEWVLDNLTVPRLAMVRHVLLYGELPKEGAGAGKA